MANQVTQVTPISNHDVIPRQADTDDQLVEIWLRRYDSENTRANYAARSGAFRLHCGKALHHVIVSDILDYLETLSEQSESTRANAAAVLKSLFGFAHKIGYLQFDVAAVVRIEKVKNTLGERILDEATTLRVIHSEPDRRNRSILTLLYSAGLRVSELCGLQWKDVAPKDGQLVLAVHGKGGETRHVLVGESVSRDLVYIRDGADGESPVFRSRKGGALNRQQVWRIVKAAGARVGVDKISPHYFRHCHASHSLDRSAPIGLVQSTLGHASLATTSKYVHAKPGDGSSLYLAV